MEIIRIQKWLSNFGRQTAAGKPARVVFATITIRGERIKAIIDRRNEQKFMK